MALDGLTNMLMHTATKPPLCEPTAKLSKKNDFSENKRHYKSHFLQSGRIASHRVYTEGHRDFFRVVHFQ